MVVVCYGCDLMRVTVCHIFVFHAVTLIHRPHKSDHTLVSLTVPTLVSSSPKRIRDKAQGMVRSS